MLATEIFAVLLTNAIEVEAFEILERTGVEQDHYQQHFRQGQLALPIAFAASVYQLVPLPILKKFSKIVKTTIQSCDINVHGDFLNGFGNTKH